MPSLDSTSTMSVTQVTTGSSHLPATDDTTIVGEKPAVASSIPSCSSTSLSKLSSLLASSPSSQSDSSRARIISATVGSTITALAVTPLEVVKVRQQSSNNIIRPSNATFATPNNISSSISGLRSTANISPCSNGCGTFVLSTGLGEYLTPRSVCKYFDPATGDLTKQAKEIAETQGTFRTIRKIYAQEGLGGIYAGLAPTLVMGIPNTVMYFYLYDELVKRLKQQQDRTRTSNPLENEQKSAENLGLLPAVAGASARFAASLTTAPLELLRTQQAARAGAMDPSSKQGMQTTTANGGMVSDFRTMIQRDGFSSLFRGVGPTLMRDVPFSAIYWVCIESMRDFWRSRRQHHQPEGSINPSTWEQFGQALINGSVSGTIAAAATTPLDVLKTRMQVVDTPRQLVAEVASSVPNNVLVCDGCDNGGVQAYQIKGGGQASELRAGMTVKVEAIQRPQSAMQIARGILENEGLRGLWRGNTARMLKVAPAAAIMISTYDVGKKLLSED
jgi:solute carrier family 25, member 39/40